ncbi:MAG: hypothetical protein Q7Q71_00600 [Verrucomicrobiota bacterium JB023]|nr:hypothetical protein [Verrucomicrobiota bacterium JB023]
MSQANDNPLKRFAAYWVAIGIFAAFGLAAVLLAPIFGQGETTAADEKNATRRLAIREEVDAAQASQLEVSPSSVFESVGARLVASKPQAVRTEKQRDPKLVAEEAAEQPAEEGNEEESANSESAPNEQ